MTAKILAVVGNGMTSQALCRWLTDAECPWIVLVYGEELRPAYDRVHLTGLFSNTDVESLEIASRDWYLERDIPLVTGRRVVSVDRAARLLRTDNGSTQAYDSLVLAAGSRPFVPPIPGVEQEGVFVFRTIEDVQGIQDSAQNCRTAAVIGAGLLGLEAAKALRDMHLVPHVVEMPQG